jgi:hypothetical protein
VNAYVHTHNTCIKTIAIFAAEVPGISGSPTNELGVGGGAIVPHDLPTVQGLGFGVQPPSCPTICPQITVLVMVLGARRLSLSLSPNPPKLNTCQGTRRALTGTATCERRNVGDDFRNV